MKEKMKSIKLDVTMAALLTVAMGVIFIAWPIETITIMVRVFAVVIGLVGLAVIVAMLTSAPVHIFGAGAGVIVTLIGVWFFLQPDVLYNFVPIVVGVWLIVHGVRDFMMTFEGRKYKASRWGLMGLTGIISILCGVYCVCCAFKIVKFTMVVMGIMLIWDGISDMFIVHKVNYAARTVINSDAVTIEDVVENVAADVTDEAVITDEEGDN